MADDRRWVGGEGKPGRMDVHGVEWFACDPYPTWYRWKDGKLILPDGQPVWADDNNAVASLKRRDASKIRSAAASLTHNGHHDLGDKLHDIADSLEAEAESLVPRYEQEPVL